MTHYELELTAVGLRKKSEFTSKRNRERYFYHVWQYQV